MISLKNLVQTPNNKLQRKENKKKRGFNEDSKWCVWVWGLFGRCCQEQGFLEKGVRLCCSTLSWFAHFLVWVAKQIQEWWLCFPCLVGWQNFHFLWILIFMFGLLIKLIIITTITRFLWSLCALHVSFRKQLGFLVVSCNTNIQFGELHLRTFISLSSQLNVSSLFKSSFSCTEILLNLLLFA